MNTSQRIPVQRKMGSTLSGDEFLDLLILDQLDDISLEVSSHVDDYTFYLYNSEQLWANRLINLIGQSNYNKKPQALTPRQFYLQLKNYPRSSSGANLALARYDEPGLLILASEGYYPDGLDLQITHPFNHYIQLTEEFLNFFRYADFGPQIIAPVSFGRPFVHSACQQVENTRINDLFYFVHPQINGQDNPLYGLLLYDYYRALLGIHIKRTNMGKPTHEMHLSASKDMRQHLRQLLLSLINEDVERMKQRRPHLEMLIHYKGEELRKALDDSTLVVQDLVDIGTEPLYMFNPNGFGFHHLERIRDMPPVVHRNEFEGRIKAQLAQTYHLIPDITPENALDRIMLINRHIITVSHGVHCS